MMTGELPLEPVAVVDSDVMESLPTCAVRSAKISSESAIQLTRTPTSTAACDSLGQWTPKVESQGCQRLAEGCRT